MPFLGFVGRFLSNAQHLDELDKQAQDKVLATYGKGIKDNTKKYQSLVKQELDTLVQKEQLQAKEEAKLNPEPTMGEAFKQFGEELVTSPWKTAKSFLYELGKDPELLLLGGGGGAVEAATATGKIAKTAQAAKAIGTAAIKPAATGATLETLAETGSPAEYNPQAIANTADVTFANAPVVLTATNSNGSQVFRHARLNLIGVAATPQDLELPGVAKLYIINNTLASYITVKNAAGASVIVPAAATMMVYNTGTNVVDAISYASAFSTLNLTATVGGKLAKVSFQISTTAEVDVSAKSVLAWRHVKHGK